jgi:hypothetical protein
MQIAFLRTVCAMSRIGEVLLGIEELDLASASDSLN